MKFNFSYPLSGGQKCIEIDEDKKYAFLFDRRMGQEVELDNLGEEYKGYVAKITGGNDKDGFSMKQGILVKGRVRILMIKGHKNYRPRRTGERKRKSVRGCIVGPDICVLALTIIKKGEADIPGLTDTNIERRLGPKRANRIRKLFALKKTDDVSLIKKSVVRRVFKSKTGKDRQKAPKIQRLITADRIRRKRIYKKEKKERWERSKKAAATYHSLLTNLKKVKDAAEKQAKVQRKESAQKAADRKSVDQGKPVQKKPEATKQKVEAPKKQAAKKPAAKN